MSDAVSFFRNKATELGIVNHLLCCDALFIPPLSGRVEIPAYARKIVEKSERFEAWAGDTLIALVAAYCNDSELNSVYITSVSALKEWQGKGIASKLVDQCIEFANQLGFKKVELEVDSSNFNALKLYTKKKFEIIKDGRITIMSLDLGKARQ